MASVVPCTEPEVMRKTRQTSPEAAAVHRAQANVCLDLAARSHEFWVTVCLTELAQELLSRANGPTRQAMRGTVRRPVPQLCSGVYS